MHDVLKLESTYIPHLRGQFENGAAVLFTGAGFSLQTRNARGEQLPSARQLTQMLWQLCFPDDEFDPSTALQDIYETAQNQHGAQLHDLLNRVFTVDAATIPPWYKTILGMPWLRIYTLNIDDLVDKALEDRYAGRRVRAISGTSGQSPIGESPDLQVIHLNGNLEDVPDGVTFSRSQYATRSAPDLAYTQLRNDLAFRSVVYIGASLEEGPFWEHIQLRGPAPARQQQELRPRGYLVIPSLNKSKEAILSRHNIVWLKMTGEEFCDTVISGMTDARDAGLAKLRTTSERISQRGGFRSVAGLLQERSNPDDSAEYLLGAEPTWPDVVKGRIAHRNCHDEIWEIVNQFRAEPNRDRFLVITGTAGTGKSSAMMSIAARLEADGISVAWLDRSARTTLPALRRAISDSPGTNALFIDDADIYDSRFSAMVHDAIQTNKSLLIVCECRSSKVDRIVRHADLGGIEPVEFTIPYLGDSDIDSILEVLERENRLGVLRGSDVDGRRQAFRRVCGRQLLVAMHHATSGEDFEKRAVDELKELRPTEAFIYGLVSVASAHRFNIEQDDVFIACNEKADDWLQSLNNLKRRKLLLPAAEGAVKARHRVIAQFVYDSLREDGRLRDVVRALVLIGATKTTEFTRPERREWRLLRTFINHNTLKRTVGIEGARDIYGEFEGSLRWNYHYWLHRGALELEADNLGLAENFLGQAKSLDEGDVFIDNEIAYLMLKKAISKPGELDSADLVQEAIDTLDTIAHTRPDQMGYAYHILGQQGLAWCEVGIEGLDEKKTFLRYIESKVDDAIAYAPNSAILRTLKVDIERAYLMLAVGNES